MGPAFIIAFVGATLSTMIALGVAATALVFDWPCAGLPKVIFQSAFLCFLGSSAVMFTLLAIKMIDKLLLVV